MPLTLGQHFLLIFAPFEFCTICLYIRIIFVLFTRSEFCQNPFFRLIIVLGIADILHVFIEIFFFRPAFFPFFAQIFLSFEKAYWIGAVNFLMNACTYFQYFMHISISLNRLSAVTILIKYKKIWKKLLPFLLPFCLFITVALCSDRLFSLGKYQPILVDQPTKLVFPLAIEFKFYQFDQSLITILFGAFTCAACLALNFFTLFLYRRLRQKNKNAEGEDGQQRMRIELNLILSALFMMVPQFLMTAFHVAVEIAWKIEGDGYINGNKANVLIYHIEEHSIWVYDIYSLGQAWILVLVCSDLRQRAILELMPKFWKSTANQILPLSAMYQNSEERN